MPKKEMNQQQTELFNELKKLSKRANQRIVRLEREFGYTDVWAVKKLRNKLEVSTLLAWTSKGRVAVNKSMTSIQMKATIKAVNQFLNSATSTKTGIKKVRRNQISSIAKSLGTDEEELTNEEAETLYEMLADDYVKWLLRYIEPSEFWALVMDAKEAHDTEEDWIKRIEDYINFGNDEDFKEKLIVIYNKYVL